MAGEARGDVEARTYGGVTFDERLTDEVQRRVLHEGICPSEAVCAGALFAAYSGHPRADLIGVAAAEVWAERATILTTSSAQPGGSR